LKQELVKLKVDLIFATSNSGAQAAQRASSAIPIVMIGDPVGAGLVADLAHPGGNITGLSVMMAELNAKRLQLLKEAIPRLIRVAVLWNPDTLFTAIRQKIAEELKAAASLMRGRPSPGLQALTVIRWR
jgi:putative ABC transport system substrate-binding protein